MYYTFGSLLESRLCNAAYCSSQKEHVRGSLTLGHPWSLLSSCIEPYVIQGPLLSLGLSDSKGREEPSDVEKLKCFLAVQPVAETALYLHLSLTHSLTNTLQDLLLFDIKERPFRHFIRVMRRHELTKKYLPACAILQLIKKKVTRDSTSPPPSLSDLIFPIPYFAFFEIPEEFWLQYGTPQV